MAMFGKVMEALRYSDRKGVTGWLDTVAYA